MIFINKKNKKLKFKNLKLKNFKLKNCKNRAKALYFAAYEAKKMGEF